MHAAHGGGGLPPGRLGVGAALRHVVRSEGLRALWKGNGVTIVHRLPYSATNFWVYEHVNEQVRCIAEQSRGVLRYEHGRVAFCAGTCCVMSGWSRCCTPAWLSC